ncbi:MAG TPA: MlaD family protein [Bryobacteraceae bacterium]|jgi:phospholipid/cholesterol/gamma-HCH transport system substrate-binding protein|nr:MlaD family protein [Bryobacteraceae bacterium]
MLFAAIIFLIGNQHSAFTKHIELFAEFKNLNGLAEGAKVQVAGLDAGEVTNIRVPESPLKGFRLKLRVNEHVQVLTRTDSVATIATEGVVGDKILIILPGTSTSPEAAPLTTLPTKDTSDMGELIQKSTTLVTDASVTMKTVGDKLATTLDAVTNTVNNANNLVVGLNRGQGTIGMLLHDQNTASDIRQAVNNVRQATSSLNHASGQADCLISDFQSRGIGGKVDAIVSDLQSRNLGEKLDQTMQNVHSATHNIDATTQQLRETMAKALGPDTYGFDAGDNIRQSFSNLNQATGNMSEDTEALKHQFFFRAFFKQRGYFSMARLAPDKYRKDKVFANPKNQRAWIEADELFESKQGEGEMLSRAGKVRIDAAVSELGDRVMGGAVVIEGYAISGAPGDQLAVSRGRAILVRDYLHTRFQLDNHNIGLVPLRGVPPPSMQKVSWNGVCIVLLTQSSG